MSVCVCRQQLQELRLKHEQKERDQKGGRRKELQGESAGEKAKPRILRARLSHSSHNPQHLTVSCLCACVRVCGCESLSLCMCVCVSLCMIVSVWLSLCV